MNEAGEPAGALESGALVDYLDLLDVGIGLFDERFRLIASNTAFRALRAYPEELCRPGVSMLELLEHNAARGDYGPGDAAAIAAERMAEFEKRAPRRFQRELGDGRILEIERRFAEQGAMVVTYADVTERERTAEALRKSERHHELVARAAREGLYEWFIEPSELHVSPRLGEIFRYELGELGAKDWNWVGRIHPEDLERYQAAQDAHFGGETEYWDCEYRIRDKTGDYRWIRDHGIATRDDDGKPITLVGAISDVTDRKEIETRHRLVLEAASEGIYDWDGATDRLWLSERLREIFDFGDRPIFSEDWHNQVHPDDAERYRTAVRDHFKAKTPRLELEYRIRRKSGEYRWVADRGNAVRDADGRAIRFVGAVSDITERVRAQERVRVSEERYALAMSGANDGLWDWDLESGEIYVSERLQDIMGMAVEGRKNTDEQWQATIHPDDVAGFRD